MSTPCSLPFPHRDHANQLLVIEGLPGTPIHEVAHEVAVHLGAVALQSPPEHLLDLHDTFNARLGTRTPARELIHVAGLLTTASLVNEALREGRRVVVSGYLASALWRCHLHRLPIHTDALRHMLAAPSLTVALDMPDPLRTRRLLRSDDPDAHASLFLGKLQLQELRRELHHPFHGKVTWLHTANDPPEQLAAHILHQLHLHHTPHAS